MNLKNLFFPAVCLVLFSCASVGPDYVSPELKAPDGWKTETDKNIKAETENPELLENWWHSFDDKMLNSLIEKAVAGNKDLKTAGYALSASRAKVKMTKADGLPAFTASGSATGIHYGDDRLSDQNIDSYQAGFDASWELDVFGGVKRDVEAAAADMEATQESLRDTLVSLLAETATNYISVRTLQSRIETANDDIRINSELYDIAENKFKAGVADASDVKQAYYQLEYSKTTLNDLRGQLKEAFNRISVLTGENPGTLDGMLSGVMPVPSIPLDIVKSIPADVIRRRPDIRKAERELAAQTARIGAAKSDLYPKFTLTGSIGYEADSVGSLFNTRNSTMSIGPSFKWALFDLGAVKQNIVVQTETQKQYLSDYEQTVLLAFEDVENALSYFDEEYKKNEQLKKALDAAKESYDLELAKYKAGVTDYTSVKTAESAYITYRDDLAQSTGSADKYLVSLYKALGGGWEIYGEKNGN